MSHSRAEFRNRHQAHLVVEALEERATPAVTFEVSPDGQLLFINGDDHANKLYVRADDAGNVSITGRPTHGKKYFEAQLPMLVTIEFHGNGGDDLFVADQVVAPYHVAAFGGLGDDVLTG